MFSKLGKLSLVRDFRSLRLVDAAAEIISRIHLEAEEAGEESERIRFIPWVLARQRQASGRRIYFRLWGSSGWLPDEATAALIGLKAELVAEGQGLNLGHKRALAYAIAENTVPQVELRRRASRFVYEGKNPPVAGVILTEAAKEIGVKRLLQMARTASSLKTPDKEFEQRLRRDAQIADRMYSEDERHRMQEMFRSIPKRQVRRPEFLRVLALKGNVGLQDLTSAYSFLMAIVLQYPGRMLHFYHSRRMKYDPRKPTPQATVQELGDLVRMGFLANIRNHYYPIDYVESSPRQSK
jgi:hypothetical protein